MAILGCIADDFTGGTDLAGMLAKAGMRTVQMLGVPDGTPQGEADAIVIALKSRTSPVADAVANSLAALAWLRTAGCRQFYFKYCSTFDSTPKGNIGPVADALMDALGTDFTIVCPAFPANKRTIYKGNLFVGDLPLNESSMRHHPLTPMTDANLVRLMQAQTGRKVGLVAYETVHAGAASIVSRFAALKQEGYSYAVVDAIDDGDLTAIGLACAKMPLVTAGSGLALGLPQNFRSGSLIDKSESAVDLPRIGGAAAIVAGSCSAATLRQVAAMRERFPAFRVDPVALAQGEDVVGAARKWAGPLLANGPVLVFATASPEEVKSVQSRFGVERAGALVEETLAIIANGLVAQGVQRLIVAGGETAGAVVRGLGVTGLRIGPEIDPGVPWTLAVARDSTRAPLALALKSGNFGTDDFFLKAWEVLDAHAARA